MTRADLMEAGFQRRDVERATQTHRPRRHLMNPRSPLYIEPNQSLGGGERKNSRLPALRIAREHRDALVRTPLGALLEHRFQKPAFLGRQVGDAPRSVAHCSHENSSDTDWSCICRVLLSAMSDRARR